jgi:hypothetical protein
MNLTKLADSRYVPDDFQNNHHYFADENGEKEWAKCFWGSLKVK